MAITAACPSIFPSRIRPGSGPVQYTRALGQWALQRVGLEEVTTFSLYHSLSAWDFEHVSQQTSMWIPAPEIARQALVKFMEIWVENATTTHGIFLVPRIMQKYWGNISKHVHEVATIYPSVLPEECAYPLLIPFFSRCLPDARMDESTKGRHFPRWHATQADYMRGL
jgi:hypothetical protein